MLKIISGSQVKILDQTHTIRAGISSWELMERASRSFVDWWKKEYYDLDLPVFIFCGAGNNGGDGLAIARLLHGLGFQVTMVACFLDASKLKPDPSRNLELLPISIPQVSWRDVRLPVQGVLIDAFLGVGLEGSLRSEAEEVIDLINSFSGEIISVDLPSGLLSEGIASGPVVKASVTVTFAFPKLALLLPEHAHYIGDLVIKGIGIADEELNAFESDFYYLEQRDIPGLHRKFHRFSHKGDFGKVLLWAGQKGKMGAAVLAAKSAMRTGTGLLTCLIPESERFILQVAIPEVMCTWELPEDLSRFDAIGIGPGIGLDTDPNRLGELMRRFARPLVLDADALSILSKNSQLLEWIPEGSILTPHIVELDRLLGSSRDHLDRMEKASQFAVDRKVNVLIKGAHSVACLPDGRKIFNSTGSVHMATAGSGDVLTGVITSFLGQGYTPEHALLCGIYHHGLAGELAGTLKNRGTIASDILEQIPESLKSVL